MFIFVRSDNGRTVAKVGKTDTTTFSIDKICTAL